VFGLTEAQTGIAVLLATSAVVSIVVHQRERRIVRAVLLSSGVATVSFQVLAALHLGYVDPFFPIALVVGGAIAAFVSTLVGTVFTLYRQLRD
jgi:ethanolamine utilization microcompartment shell protein EutS